MDRKGDNTDSARSVNREKRIFGLEPERRYTKREVNEWAEDDRLAGEMTVQGFRWQGGKWWSKTAKKRRPVFEWASGADILQFLEYGPTEGQGKKPKSPRKKRE